MDNKVVDNDTVNTVVDNLKHTRLLAGIGIAAMILGTILPYIKYTTILGTLKISLWESWKGKIVLVLLIINAIFLFKDYIEKYIPSLLNVPVWKKISEKYQYAMVPSLIAMVFVILITMNLDIGFGLYNIGFYIFWLGVICVVIYLIINKGKAVMPDKSNVKKDETYDDLKNTNNQANNINQNYNNVANNNVNQNYNNVANNNVNQNYNNVANNNVNQNYNNTANNNVNQNNDNGINNINPNYNNTMNYGINQNNNMNYNANSGYNNQNANNTMNYTPDNKDINNVANYNQGSNTNINNGINYNQGSNTNINNGINYNQGNNVKNNEMNPNNNQNNNM